MKQIKKIQPKVNADIDLDILTQRIKEGNKTILNEEIPIKTPQKTRTITKNEQLEVPLSQKKAGRKKQNIEEMHRFAIDLPLWLFEKIKIDADQNYSTVRGQIIKLLLMNYKT